MSNRWTHNICIKCWNERNPSHEPIRLRGIGDDETCCFCGAVNSDGIYVRYEPDALRCKGHHKADMDGDE